MVEHARLAEARSLTVTLSVAAAGWAVAVTQMRGMDMGVATGPGSFGFFLGVWTAMMAAMMLPGAVPAVLRHARATGHASTAAVVFGATYLSVWTLVGLLVYGVDRPHSSLAAGIVAIAAGLYELTPLKRHTRQRCRAYVRSGFQFGGYCVGSSIGLMLLFVALGVMSLAWMSAVGVLVLVQKLLPPRASFDFPIALAIVGLGVVIVTSPSVIPGLVPSM